MALICDNLEHAEVVRKLLRKNSVSAEFLLTKEEFRVAKFEDVTRKERFNNFKK